MSMSRLRRFAAGLLALVLAVPLVAGSRASAAGPYVVLRKVSLTTPGYASPGVYDGTSLWVAGGTSGSIYAIDPATALVTTYPTEFTSLGETPDRLAADANYVWALNVGYNASIHLIRLTKANGAVTDFTIANPTVNSNPVWNDLASDGSYVYVVDGYGTVVKIDSTTGALVTQVDVGGYGGAVVLSGTSLWVAAGNTGEVQRLSTVDLTTQASITVPGADAFSGRWAQDTDYVYTVSYNGTIGQISKSTGAVQTYTLTLPAGSSAASVAVSGTHLWVTAGAPGDYSVWPLELTGTTWGAPVAFPMYREEGLVAIGGEVWAGGFNLTGTVAAEQVWEIGIPALYVVPTAKHIAYGSAAPAGPFYTFTYYADAAHTIPVSSPSIASAPTCTSTYALGSTGSVDITCSGGDAGSAYSYLDVSSTATLTIDPVASTLTATPASGRYEVGASLDFEAAVAATSAPTVTCPTEFDNGESSGSLFGFSLDRDPTTGTTGSYSLSSGTVSTTGWLPGVYTLTITYGDNPSCSSGVLHRTIALGVPMPALPPTL